MRQLPIQLTNNHTVASPLRYPGGKSVLSGFIAEAVASTGCVGGTYVEPYSGGAGVGLRLLTDGTVSKLIINDFDPAVYAFWDSVLHHSVEFLKRFDQVDLTVEEWLKQREVLRSETDEVALGFAFFFLNRTCRSGVPNGGVIGGLEQTGRYKINARFNRKALRAKLVAIAQRSDCISVLHEDGADLIRRFAGCEKTFLYVDPPYVEKGRSLYLNAFSRSDHERLAEALTGMRMSNWLLTYDNTPLIRQLYGDYLIGSYRLSYSAHRRRNAEELMLASQPVAEFIDQYVEECEQ